MVCDSDSDYIIQKCDGRSYVPHDAPHDQGIVVRVNKATVHFVTGTIWNTELMRGDMYNYRVEREWIRKRDLGSRALVSCQESSNATFERCETLLYEWEQAGPK